MMLRLAMATILAVTLASAQRGGGGGRGGGGEGGDTFGMMQAVSPFDRMGTMLALDKNQKKEMKPILDEAQKEAAPIRDQMLKCNLEIGEAIQAGKSQEEITKAEGAYAALEAQMAGIEMKAFAKLYRLLDKEQQAKSAPVFVMMHGIFNGKNWNESRP